MLVYFGYPYSTENQNKNKNNKYIHNHMNRLEQSLILSLRTLNKHPLVIFSASSVAQNNISKVDSDTNIGLIQLTKVKIPVLKDFIILIKMLKFIFHYTLRYRIIFIVINNHYHYQLPLLFLSLIRFKFSQINFLIDYPHVLVFKKFRLKKILEDLVSFYSFKRHRYYLFLAEPTNISMLFMNKVHHEVFQYPIEEAMRDNHHLIDYKNFLNSKRIIYVGALEKYYCVDFIIKLSRELVDNFIIEVYGRGSFLDYIIQEAATNKRLKYMGYIDENLIPDAVKGSFALLLFTCHNIHNYQVPSKLFQYLGYCTPIITNGFNSLESEYIKLLNPLENLSIDEVNNFIFKLSHSELVYRKVMNDLEKLTKIFIKEQDNNKVRIKKLIDKVKYN